MQETLVIDLPVKNVPVLILEDDSAFELQDAFYFGANENCDIQRALPGIEPVHFSLHKCYTGQWKLSDLQHGEPVKVNGEIVDTYTFITNGDVIETKWSSFVFRELSE